MSRSRAPAVASGGVDDAGRPTAVRRFLVLLTVALAILSGAFGAGAAATADAAAAGGVGAGAASAVDAGIETIPETAGTTGPVDARPAPNGTRIVHAGDALTLQSGPGQAVRGRTGLSAGTQLTVRLQSADAEEPYLRSKTTTVGAGGAFRAVFDLSEVPAGTALAVVVHREGSTRTRTTAEVVACTDDCQARTPETPSAVVDADGGQVALESAPGQPILVRTNLPPGTAVQVRLRSSSGPSPFIKQGEGLVDGNGTVRAVFDFDGIPPGTEFELTVLHNGTTLTTARGVVACMGACPSDTPTGENAEAADVGVVQVENGSTARIRVRLGDAGTTTLAVGGPGTNYTLSVVLEDRTGDDEVVLVVNTTAASRGGKTVSTADGGDYVRVSEERGTLTATEYRLVLRPADNESATLATGLLVVTQDGSGTPLLTTTPDPASTVPLGSAAALVGGALLAVAGLAFLLGLVER